jgi:hypothetical protein
MRIWCFVVLVAASIISTTAVQAQMQSQCNYSGGAPYCDDSFFKTQYQHEPNSHSFGQKLWHWMDKHPISYSHGHDPYKTSKFDPQPTIQQQGLY